MSDFINHQYLKYLRVFFPTWEFFSNYDSDLKLCARYAASETEWTDWMALTKPIDRNISNLFINPEGNWKHALNTHLWNFINEIQNYESENEEAQFNQISELTSYLITDIWVRNQAPAIVIHNSPLFNYQFQLLVDNEIFFESPIKKHKNPYR